MYSTSANPKLNANECWLHKIIECKLDLIHENIHQIYTIDNFIITCGGDNKIKFWEFEKGIVKNTLVIENDEKVNCFAIIKKKNKETKKLLKSLS